jgi:MFS transporter, FHS family, glucose/mannose:H+ symporter
VPIGPTLLFAAIFFVYVAAEVSTASWAPTHLSDRLGPARAALTASAFWLAMTVGRFVAAAVASRIRPGPLVVAASALGMVGLLLTQFGPLALAGYVVAGLALGPVFPTSVAWLQARFGPDTERVGPLVIASGNLGPVLGAPAIGMAVAALGVGAIPIVLGGVVAVLASLALAAVVGSSRQPSPAEG